MSAITNDSRKPVVTTLNLSMHRTLQSSCVSCRILHFLISIPDMTDGDRILTCDALKAIKRICAADIIVLVTFVVR